MAEQFLNVYKTVVESDEFKKFIEKHPSYYLAHGFLQFDKNKKVTKDWQLGFYSKENDNLALFITKPKIKFTGFEDAFKEEGIIEKLEFDDKSVDVEHVEEIIGGLLATKYSEENPTSYILIIQSKDGKALYNITTITESFAMITIQVDANSGKIISHVKRSILSLKKDDDENDKNDDGEEE
jgi:hypothetical protein